MMRDAALFVRLPADFTPEARERFEEIAALARTVADRIVRDKAESDEPAATFDPHVRKAGSPTAYCPLPTAFN